MTRMPGRGQRRGKGSDLVQRDGALALTFVNTGSRRSPRLRSYADLLAWSKRYGGLTAASGERLAALAAGSPEGATAAFAAAEELHGLLSTIMNLRADRLAPEPAMLAELDALLARIAPRRRLVQGPVSLVWDWPADRDDVADAVADEHAALDVRVFEQLQD